MLKILLTSWNSLFPKKGTYNTLEVLQDCRGKVGYKKLTGYDRTVFRCILKSMDEHSKAIRDGKQRSINDFIDENIDYLNTSVVRAFLSYMFVFKHIFSLHDIEEIINTHTIVYGDKIDYSKIVDKKYFNAIEKHINAVIKNQPDEQSSSSRWRLMQRDDKSYCIYQGKYYRCEELDSKMFVNYDISEIFRDSIPKSSRANPYAAIFNIEINYPFVFSNDLGDAFVYIDSNFELFVSNICELYDSVIDYLIKYMTTEFFNGLHVYKLTSKLLQYGINARSREYSGYLQTRVYDFTKKYSQILHSLNAKNKTTMPLYSRSDNESQLWRMSV